LGRGERLVVLASITLILLAATYSFGKTAWSLHELEADRGGRGYVTDEVWYVSAARNILRRVFGVEPRQLGVRGATVVFSASGCATRWTSIKDTLVDLASRHGLSSRADYVKTYAIYVNGSESGVEAFVREAGELCPVVDVVRGWMLPDAENVHEYINWEHPPLGKYTIALSMVLLGDAPVYWRLPSVAAGTATSVLVYFTLLKVTRRRDVPLIGALLVIADPMSRALFSIALLDGYTALFTAASLYLAACKKYRESLLLAVTGGLFKATGLFAAMPVVLLLARESALKASRKPAVFVRSLVAFSLVAAILYLSSLVLVSAPIISYMGLRNWVEYALIGSIRWHLSVKCTGAQCPVSSAPWEWFVGLNSFPLYIYPDGKVLYAEGFYPLWLASLILLVFYLPAVFTGFKEYGYVALFYAGVLGSYVLLWILGSRTQYSFYGVQLAPLVYMNLVFVTYLALTREEFTQRAARAWNALVLKLIGILLE